MRLGYVKLMYIEAALTCFPAAESFSSCCEEPLVPAEESRMVELLRGHGGTLKDVNTDGEVAERLNTSAMRAGALPNLTYTNLSLADPIHREILSGGMLPLLEDVDVRIDRGEHVAALAPLRHLKHLRSLGIECREALEAALPPFFPPSLKALHLDIVPSATLPLMLLELPSTLQASGARLEEVVIGETQDLSDLSAEGGAALANVLQRFSSTLKTVKLFGTGCSASWCRAS
jgi:hypothetical protein